MTMRKRRDSRPARSDERGARGDLDLFGPPPAPEPRGDMQFAVRRLEAEGDGLWRKALERTRAKLEKDGLLARERKRPLPRYPRVVAVVTSPDGAALHDIAAVVRRRAPHVKLVVV